MIHFLESYCHFIIITILPQNIGIKLAVYRTDPSFFQFYKDLREHSKINVIFIVVE